MIQKKIALAGAFAALLALNTACSSSKKHEDKQAPPPTPVQAARMQLDTDRNNYVASTQTRIDQMTKFAQDLRGRAASVQKPQSKKLENAADDMDSLLKDATKELADVKNAAPENWVDEKRDVEKVMSRAETQYSSSVPLLQ